MVLAPLTVFPETEKTVVLRNTRDGCILVQIETDEIAPEGRTG